VRNDPVNAGCPGIEPVVRGFKMNIDQNDHTDSQANGESDDVNEGKLFVDKKITHENPQKEL
jgi:hypothetical protein